ncbi:hypothetical protein [Tautonia sociabilis]|uniref:Uncharacterized protein n=1 Tax=Tautonia sociabilis TaxID=2080755 RepID=A0A432MMI6_9BACT|nr:hypothetical protein [Tautonia sociabilis]RUL88407.1 hypothetical protein TsocGM_07745 [Tautonia sociabilis]
MRRHVPLIAALGLWLVAPIGIGVPAGLAQDEGPTPIPDFALDQTLPTVEVPRGGPRVNETVIDATPLPRDKAPQIDYRDQQANFTIGERITGQQSGATGIILADDDQGFEGTLTLGQVTGEFKEGELLSGSNSGAATADSGLREGVWVLDFAFKPLRTWTIDIPGKGRRTILYLYYRVINRTGKPRMFVPQFFLETDEGKRYPDVVLPQAVEVVRAREHSKPPLLGAPILGAVQITGMIPPSEKEGVDEAVHGVAVWILDRDIARSDSLSIYVRGLSDGLQIADGGPDGSGDEATVKYKTLRIDFATPGDEFDVREREFRLKAPPYEWVYD